VKVIPIDFSPETPIVITLIDKDGTVYGTTTADSNGYALIKVSSFSSAGLYTITASCGNYWGTLDLEVAPYDMSIWNAVASLSPDGENVMITFFETPVSKTGTFDGCITINGVTVQTGTSVDGTSILIPYQYNKLQTGDKIIIAGVKYPDLFPSYSFTFSIDVTQ